MHSAASPSAFGVERFTVPAVLDLRSEQHPDRLMMSIAGEPVTFAQMCQRSCAAAHLLIDRGVRCGDTVALFTGTCPEWVYFWLGAARIGALSAALNGANKGDFLAHALRLSDARLVLTDAERQARIAEVADRVQTLDHVLVVGDALTEQLGAASTSTPPGQPVGSDDVGVLFFTSGTTGPSKAVAASWHYLFSMAATAAVAWEFAAAETLWSAMPLFHLSAAATVLAPMLVGATTVLARSFHPSEVWDAVRDCGAAGFVGAGAMVSMLWNLPPDPRDAQLPLRFISAAPIAANLYRGIEQRYSCRVVTMYGLTEAFPITYQAISDGGVPGTSGTVNPAFEVRIADDHGQSLAAGQVGEILCHPIVPHVMSEGYVTAAEGQGLRIDRHPDWFHTGDLGRLDGDGQLTYVDRIKDSLRRRGENVSSVEIEATVMQHPAVVEAAAVGVPSDLGEDDILVLLTLHTDDEFDPADLLDFCAARMPYFCVPRYLEVLDEIPKNILGRIRKDLLRARGLGTAAWDREANGYILTR